MTKNGYSLLALFALITGALAFASIDSLINMEQKWGNQEEYGYAYMVPFITMFFIWQRIDALSNTQFRFSYSGFILLVFAVLVIFLGVLSATYSIAQYGFVLSVIATVLMLLGPAATKVIIGPLLLLFLIVPLPVFIFNNLSSFLQLISSEIGVAVIRLFGISVFLEGNVIDLGVYKLQVVEACNGLRYLFPLLSLSIISAFIYKEAMWKRVVVVLSSIPITVLMNSFRIGVIGVLVEYWGIEQAEGFLHDFEGWIIFMACLGILVLEMWLLHLLSKDGRSFAEVFGLEFPENPDYRFNLYPVNFSNIIAAVFVAVLALGAGIVNEREEVIPQRTDFSNYPLTIGEWNGVRDRIEQNVLDALRLTDYIIADFKNDNSDLVNLYIAYYESQRSGQAAHSPKSCIPGGGWRITSHTVVEIPDTDITTNRMLIRKGDHAQLVYYWFDQRGETITNEYLVKWDLFKDSMLQGRTDGALVRLTIPVMAGDDLEVAEQHLVNFATLIEPSLKQYIPE